VGAFHLGPVYYYFQIISAKIFGDQPDKLAYPDLLFSILSIPLLYFFLKIYFSRNLSLGLAGLHAISAYFISYSRLAWNSNPVPFFALLFIFSLYKFLEKNEEAHWIWAILLGIAMGVGFQLHAITMILFPAVAFFALVFSMKKNRRVWKKWAVAFLVFVILNLSQIISEARTDFSNTKTLFSFPLERNVGSVGSLTLAKNDLVCHIEANFVFLSSYGNGDEKCSAYFDHILPDGQKKHMLENVINLAVLLISLAFSIVGYFLLVRYDKKETERTKKYFLRLLILYSVMGFLVMFFVSGERMSYIKYLRFGFFMPYVLLGFLIKSMSEKSAKDYVVPAGVIIFLLVFSNAAAISKEATPLLHKNRTCSLKTTTLGEIEPIADYIAAHSNSQKILYFGVDNTNLPAFVDPLEYLFRRRNVVSNNLGARGVVDLQETGNTAFVLSCNPKKNYLYHYKKINGIYIYEINK
jgi:4-amino-4-deoxy-L-arabinose transferase-like glycosyltransferase